MDPVRLTVRKFPDAYFSFPFRVYCEVLFRIFTVSIFQYQFIAVRLIGRVGRINVELDAPAKNHITIRRFGIILRTAKSSRTNVGDTCRDRETVGWLPRGEEEGSTLNVFDAFANDNILHPVAINHCFTFDRLDSASKPQFCQWSI